MNLLLRKTISTFVLLISLTSIASAQINGLFASKFAALTAEIMEEGTAELEPTFNVVKNTGLYDREGRYQQLDTMEIQSSLCWRFTYGVSDWLELGLNIPSDVSFGNFAAKVKVVQWDGLGLSIMSGVGIPMGNRSFAKNGRYPSEDQVSNYGIGLIASVDLDTITSIDFNIQYQDYFSDGYERRDMVSEPPLPIPNLMYDRQTGSSLFINLEIGRYVINDDFLVVGGLAYQSSVIGDDWNAAMTGVLGFAWEKETQFVIAPAIYYNFWGIDSPRSLAAGLSLTTILD